MSATVPTGFKVYFLGNPVQLSAASPTGAGLGFRLYADPSVAPGDYLLNVTGTAGSVTEKLTVPVSVTKYLVIEQGQKFVPVSLTVPAGSKVFWLNLDAQFQNDPETHNVRIPSLNVNSPDMLASPYSGVFSYTFTAAGSYNYFCSYHPGMTGTIAVSG